MKSLQGNLVIASPHLMDPNFIRTVVLMIQHSEEGAFGVVLNRRSDRTVQEIWEKMGEDPCGGDRPIHLGGPVVGPLMAVHAHEELSDIKVLDGVYFSTQKEKLQQLVLEESEPYRLLIGYAGWGEGQLESELETGSWITTAATYDYVFHEPHDVNDDEHDLWTKVTKDLTDSVLFSTLKIKEVPNDPTMN